MRQTTSPARLAACRSLGAVVLLAFFALLHATSAQGPHTWPPSDGCRQRAAVVREHTCDLTPAAVATGLGADEHHDGDASQSCDASAPGPRQSAYVSPAHTVAGTAADTGAGGSVHGGMSGAARSVAPVSPSAAVSLAAAEASGPVAAVGEEVAVLGAALSVAVGPGPTGSAPGAAAFSSRSAAGCSGSMPAKAPTASAVPVGGSGFSAGLEQTRGSVAATVLLQRIRGGERIGPKVDR
ncbi:hypothetical protein [Streptomyces violaceusniger]|uniref:Secreted protein n=1 Tax=Streptomyces violaceusniger (strain Tu 4113) TaxID=653045 RepID=G2PCG1_STRV4|nr:hypothetical protein [Streptomyces violaceusniger]AEM81989.1 hypothetical protein Strvi_2262 [Streptomyces violaceusniger Tu 4113]